MLLTVHELATQLQIKPSTLYAWAKRGKIPCCRLHRLVRFDPDAIAHWLEAMAERHAALPLPAFDKADSGRVQAIIARAMREAYTAPHGETRPAASPQGKEEGHGAR